MCPRLPPHVDQSHDPEGQAAAAGGRVLGGRRLQGGPPLQDDVGVVGAGRRCAAVGGAVLAQEAAVRQEGVHHQRHQQGAQTDEEVQNLWREGLGIRSIVLTCDRVRVLQYI